MGVLRSANPSRILPIEVRDVLRGSSKWGWFVFVIAGLVAVVEAVSLANLLFLGYGILGQEITGPLGGLIEKLGLTGYSQRTFLVLLGSIFIVVVSVRLVLVVAFRYLAYKWSTVVARKIYKEIIRRILSSPLKVFDEHQLGEIIHGLMNSPDGAITATSSSTSMVASVFLIGSFAVMMILISPWLLLIAAVIAIVWFAAIVPPIKKRMQRHQQQKYDRQQDGVNIATNAINGIRDIRALSAEDRWVAEFSERVDLWETARGRITLLMAFPTPTLQTMLQICFASVTIIAAIVLSPDVLVTQLPVLGVFAYGLFRVYPVVGQASQAWISLGRALPNLRAGQMWTGLPEDSLAGGTESLVGPINTVRFDRLSFSYDLKKPTIIDADFSIKAGEMTALVGSSGAGKSTLIDLMLKFRCPSQGRIWIGGQNLNDVFRRSWLDRVDLVRQDVFLFAGTIRENLLEYRVNATEEELRSACRRAGALEFIDAMPHGLDTRIGERGLTVSGGQRQRIAIARSLLRNSDILILDEAMSALDGEIEAQILKSILMDSPRSIIVLISHRLATVRNANNIVVLDQGRVVEQGTHAELVKLRRRYWELFATQLEQESGSLVDVGRT